MNFSLDYDDRPAEWSLEAKVNIMWGEYLSRNSYTNNIAYIPNEEVIITK